MMTAAWNEHLKNTLEEESRLSYEEAVEKAIETYDRERECPIWESGWRDADARLAGLQNAKI
jgi:hypothetical protein